VAFVAEAKRFVKAARQVGQAEASHVDDYLRQAIVASLAGDHAAAHAVLETLLEPISNGTICLGQEEMVEEVLSVNLHECVRRFLAAAYVITPMKDRAEALVKAMDAADGLSWTKDPIEDIQSVLGEGLLDLEDFLPMWIARLERSAKESSDSESIHERWLRAAVGRRDGVTGLERLTRATKRPEAARDWCNALVAARDWSKALGAYETSSELVEQRSRGEFLDGAALAAQQLGRKDVLKKLDAAWLGAPSLLRLLRWLIADKPSASTIRKRAESALSRSPTNAPRFVGMLQILVADIASAAKQLENSEGLGWSDAEHAGHLLFPVFAWLLGGSPAGSVRAGLSQSLHRPVVDQFHFDTDLDGDSSDSDGVSKLSAPTIIEILERADVQARLKPTDRATMLDAMKAAADSRMNGVLTEKRRSYYGHAAALIACCVELENTAGAPSPWAEALRAQTSRFPAFQAQLRAALAQAQSGR